MKKKKKLKTDLWSKKDIKLLKKVFPNMTCLEAAKKLGRPFFAVKRKAYRLGIYKSKQYLKSIGKEKK
jgi:hypothetical protein